MLHVFTLNSVKFVTNEKHNRFGKIAADDKTKTISKAEFDTAGADPAAEWVVPKDEPKDEPKAPKDEVKDEPKDEAKDEAPKTKKHPTADTCLANMPKKFTVKVNNKGHILIKKSAEDATTICRIRPLKDGMYIFPGKELKAAREDWEKHEGWANEYALKVADWTKVEEVVKDFIEA